MLRRLLIGIAASVALPVIAGAQNRCPSCMDSVSGEWHMLPALGLRAGIPQKLSAAAGIVAGRNYRERGHTEDMALYVEPGLSAGRASIAYVSGFGNMGSGFGVAATGIRTWKDPVNMPTNTTLAGLELWAWPMFFSGPRVGVFRRITGPTHGWYFAADFGFGL
jgi:hypothetical protein